MITKQQIKIIHCLKNALKLSDEKYRQRVMSHHKDFGASSLDMSYSEANDLLKEMEAEAVERSVWKRRGDSADRPRKYDNLGNRPGMASPAQLRMIEALWKGVSYTHDPEKRDSALRKFIFRICKKSAMEFLESRDIARLVNAMKNMKR